MTSSWLLVKNADNGGGKLLLIAGRKPAPDYAVGTTYGKLGILDTVTNPGVVEDVLCELLTPYCNVLNYESGTLRFSAVVGVLHQQPAHMQFVH